MSMRSFMLWGDQPRKTIHSPRLAYDCTCESMATSLDCTSLNLPRPNMSASIMAWMIWLPSLPGSMPYIFQSSLSPYLTMSLKSLSPASAQ